MNRKWSILVFVTLIAGLSLAQSARRNLPTALYERKGSEIVEAPAEDLALAQTYHSFKNKGRVKNGQRITILTKSPRYLVGETVRVLHVLEAVKPGIEVYVMGPKPIFDEFVDGKLASPKSGGPAVYDGAVMKGPWADFHYDISTYTFTQSGKHTIQWKGGGHPIQGDLGLTSNVIHITVVEK